MSFTDNMDMKSAEVPCPRCGSRNRVIVRPAGLAAVREWLRKGGPWRPTSRVCLDCGGSSSTGSYLTARPAAVWAVRMVLARRRMVPVPATYLWAALFGAGLGVAADLVLGWPWWLIMVACVTAVALFFMSTAFWPRDDRRRSPLG